MNYRFHPHAESELYEAQDWYEAQRKGLGFEFLTTISQAIDSITANPKTYGYWPGNASDARRFVLPRFPYAIAYLVGDGVVELLALVLTSRRPLYWVNFRCQLPPLAPPANSAVSHVTSPSLRRAAMI